MSSSSPRPHLNSVGNRHFSISRGVGDDCHHRNSYHYCQQNRLLPTTTTNRRGCSPEDCCCDEFDLDFAAGTSCHGIYFICNSSWSWYRRLCWLLLVACSLALLATQLHDRWATFLKFELKTEVAIESARSLLLPTVTLCNANFFSRRSFTAIDHALIENVTYTIASDIENDVSELDLAGATLPSNWTLTYWQAAAEYEILEKNVLEEHNADPKTFSMEKWLQRMGWQFKPSKASGLPKPLIQCRVGKVACSVEDFKPILTPQGLCYSLNSPPRYVQKAPGGLAGINIFLDINQEDYSRYNLEGQSQFECGVKVILHEWYERPNVGQSVGIPPGMSGFVAIKASKRKTDDEAPWSNCIPSEGTNPPYSEKQCLSECTARQTMADCGCRLWYEPGNGTLCGVARTTACLLFKELVGEDTAEEELRCKRSCLEACDVTSYSASVSYTLLASNATIEELTNELMAATNDSRYTQDYVRANVIALQIAFAQLVVDRTYSTPALTLSAFLSDVGGQLGLFAGISLITVIELIEYPIAKLVARMTGNRMPESLRTRRRRRNQYSSSANLHDCNCNNCISNGNNNNNNNNNRNNGLDTTTTPVIIDNIATSLTNGNGNGNSNSNHTRTDPISEVLRLDSFDKTV